MSEIIERVAIAIRRNKFERAGRGRVFDPSLCTEEELGEARAAIAAIYEPTEAMNEAGFAAACEHDNGGGGVVPELEIGSFVWKAMFDEALK